MKEPKNYMFFLLGSYHWFMYLTFLLVTVQFQVVYLEKLAETKKILNLAGKLIIRP